MKKLLLYFFPFFLSAQDAEFTYSVQDDIKIEKRATINLRSSVDKYVAQLMHLEAPAVGGKSYRGFLRGLKQEQLPKYLAERDFSNRALHTATTDFELEQGMNFRGNPFNGIPSDNDIAISNDGMLVSVVNSTILVTDINDPEFEEIVTSLNAFSSELDVATDRFDPKVIYDPNADRFIVICLAGSSSTEFFGGQLNEQTIVVAFSENNDPTDDWSVYAVSGIPFMNNTWSDYPQLAITERELFITVNLIEDDVSWQEGFAQSVIWQIFMQDGYIGNDELTARMYSDIKHNDQFLRYLCPIKDAEYPEGDNMYFVSNENYIVEEDTFYYEFQNQNMYLLEVSGLQFASSTDLSVDFLQTDLPYGIAPLAKQPEGLLLNTNDARVLGGYFHNGNIHFVGNSISLPSERTGVYHGQILDVGGSNTVIGHIIDDPVLEFAYPNISYTGSGFDDQNIITFDHTGEEVFPGISGVAFGEGEYSEVLTIKEGESYITYNSVGLDKRWGDYTGSQRKYNEPGKVWVSGTFGASDSNFDSNVYGTWVSELSSTFNSQVSTGLETSGHSEAMNIFPNPTAELANVVFEMPETFYIEAKLIAMDGRLVDTIFRGNAKSGTNQISFLTNSINAGTYLLRIDNGQGQSFYEEKLLIQR